MQLAPVTLAGAHVRLEPFDPALYGAALRALADSAPEQFVLWSHRGPGDWVGLWLETIAARSAAGTMIPLSVLSPDGADFLGITSYLDPNSVNRSVEIGMTVYAPHAAGAAINPAAVLKLGAKREGILRNHRTLPDGFVRDTAFFSIIDTEWPEVKARLDARLAAPV